MRSLLLLSALAIPAVAQNAPMPPDYRGVQTYIPGIFITPVPNSPFTADVEIVSHQKLPNGTEHVRTTINHIARDSAGRIYNERRQLVPTSFKGEPRLLSAHIFDPSNRVNIFYDPATHIARAAILNRPPVAPQNSVPNRRETTDPTFKQVDLGEQNIDGTVLHGIEKQRTVDAALSGTGKPVTITDQYWYSPDLSVYLIIKHNDPRTGEQIVGVTHIDRHEPPASMLVVPAEYKVVDENPPQQVASAPAPGAAPVNRPFNADPPSRYSGETSAPIGPRSLSDGPLH